MLNSTVMAGLSLCEAENHVTAESLKYPLELFFLHFSKQNILKGLGCAQKVAKDLSKEREQHVNELCTPCPSEEEFLNFLDSLMNAKSGEIKNKFCFALL